MTGVVRIVIGQVAEGDGVSVLERGIIDIEAVVIHHQLHAGTGKSGGIGLGHAGFVPEVGAVVDRCIEIAHFRLLRHLAAGND